MKKRSNVIHASELTDYGYCVRSWHLRRVVGVDSQKNSRRMRDGTALHRRHGVRVALVPVLHAAAVALLLIAVALLAFGMN